MQSPIEKVVDILKDGKWHTLSEISRKSRLHELKIEILTDFLASYSFLHLNKNEGKTKLSKTFANFLEKTHPLQNLR